MIIIQSLDNITDAMNIDQSYDLDTIIYDIESWYRTPTSEQIDPPNSISRGARIVHEAGYRYGITPDRAILMDNYKMINWTEVDFLGMQLQRLAPDVDEYSRVADEIVSFVKCKNPNIEIFIQLSFNFSNANGMIEAIESVKDIVDGFIIAYIQNGTSDLCIPACSEDDLDSVLDRINRLS
jgi:hypothetical protein